MRVKCSQRLFLEIFPEDHTYQIVKNIICVLLKQINVYRYGFGSILKMRCTAVCLETDEIENRPDTDLTYLSINFATS